MTDKADVPNPQAHIRANTAGLISAFYLEIEYLLERVERATNHYQTLGVDRSAGPKQVIGAFENAMMVLQPPQKKVRDALPEELRIRIAEAFAKVSEAQYVLLDAERRAIYDGGGANKKKFARVPPADPLRTKPLVPPAEAKDSIEEPSTTPASEQASPQQGSPSSPSAVNSPADDSLGFAPSGAEQTISIRFYHEQERAFVKATKDAAAKLRRCERFKLSIPALVTGYERGGQKWKEVTKTLDVSRVGASVKMQRRVKHGTIVHVTLPLPTKLRSHGFTEPGYNTYAIVRRIQPPMSGSRLVGLEFIGMRPPGDFLKKPWATFRTQKWVGLDRRAEPRQTLVERVEIEYLDDSHNSLGKETAVTENVSASGARIRVKQPPATFDWILVKSPKRGFESIAALRNQYVGKDDIERLCIQFIEKKWPDMPTSFEPQPPETKDK